MSCIGRIRSTQLHVEIQKSVSLYTYSIYIYILQLQNVWQRIKFEGKLKLVNNNERKISCKTFLRAIHIKKKILRALLQIACKVIRCNRSELFRSFQTWLLIQHQISCITVDCWNDIVFIFPRQRRKKDSPINLRGQTSKRYQNQFIDVAASVKH